MSDEYIPEPEVSKSSALAGCSFGIAIIWLCWLVKPTWMIWMGPVAVVYFIGATFWEYSKEKQELIAHDV